MSTDNVTEVQLPQPVAWLGMTPLFVIDEGVEISDAIGALREDGTYSVFYILGEQHITGKIKENHVEKTVTTVHPRLFKVVNNLVGNATAVVDNTGVNGLKEINQTARFELPKIPYDLILEVDAFFREIHQKHGTEAIIIFTYDKDYLNSDDPEEGWGIVVPKQKNTAGSCDYDPTSVVDMLPDDPHEVYLVGTAHSHPHMSAYCSGVDKADQASFDGIHITFGWQKNSYSTEWHVELQMGGAAYTMLPEHTFSGLPQPKNTERIQEWAKNVEKKYPNVGGGYGNSAGNPTMGTTTSSGGTAASSKVDYTHLPKDLPEPSGTDVIVSMPLLNANEIKDCPVCRRPIGHTPLSQGKCNQCNSYIVSMEVGSIEELRKIRLEKKLVNHDLDFDDTKQWKSVWLWEERTDDHGKVIDNVELLREGANVANGGGLGKAEGTTGDSSSGSAEVLECVACYEILHPSEEFCDVCGTPSAVKDIADLYGYINTQIAVIASNRENVSDGLKSRGDHYMVCCDRESTGCDCDLGKRVSFRQMDELVEQFQDLEPYDPVGGCEECVLRFTVACEPYRGYLADMVTCDSLDQMQELDQIYPCSEFTMESDVEKKMSTI